jgi:hypothetical protein
MDWADLISNLGFPIVVAGFLLWKLDKTLKELTKAINKAMEVLEDNNKR